MAKLVSTRQSTKSKSVKKKRSRSKPTNGLTSKNVANRLDGRKRHFVPISEGTKLSGIRKKLFLDRYSMKDETGDPLEKYPEQSWRRMAWALSRVEKAAKLRREWEEKFYLAMEDFKFVPGGRFWCSAGTGTQTSVGSCFVVPSPHDSRKGIMKTLHDIIEINAHGSGVGFNISSLRPRGSYIKKVNGTTSGAVSWAELCSVATHDIIQHGGSRRGALMTMLWDWHPDIEEFITIKKQQGKLLGSNLSVCVSDSFMDAVKENKNWKLKFPDTSHKKYDSQWNGDIQEWEAKRYPVKVYKKIKARSLWDLICESAWASAEPGVVFLDTYNKMNNSWYFEKIISVNVCGEQGLPAWGMCNLSSLNLSAFIKNDEFDFDSFKNLVRVGVRFLDNATDTEKYTYTEIEEVQKRERRMGLGTMGLADALIKLGIRYGSKESLELIDKVYKTLRDVSYETSIELAKEKGKFPMFDRKKYLKSGFIKTLPGPLRKKIWQYGIRNSHLVTEAPTGKISLLAGVSSGIEPIFSFSYKQKDRLGERTMYHPLYKAWVDKNSESGIPDYFVVADDLTPEEHVEVQALVQGYTDSSISKTVNAPSTHTVEDVKKLYRLAYETGCKGISYMRESSRDGTLVRDKRTEKADEYKDGETTKKPYIWERSTKVTGATYRLKTPVGTAFITVNHDELGAPVEVFINVGKAGSDVQAMAEALGRVISKSLKFASHLSSQERAVLIIGQLRGIGGSRTVGFGAEKIASLPDAVAKALALDMGVVPMENGKAKESKDGLEESILEGKQLSLESNEDKKQLILLSRKADICPSCGNATLVHETGCKTCHGCGYSEC
jgi:ribonucleoside-diphosphate reductase alpha chain